MRQRTTSLAAGAVAGALAVGAVAGLLLLPSDGDVTAPAAPIVASGVPNDPESETPDRTTSPSTRPDFAITTDDLTAMVIDAATLVRLNPRVASALVPRSDEALFVSPLAVGRERLLDDQTAGVAGWRTSFSVDGSSQPPVGHQGLFAMVTDVYLFQDDIGALAEFFGLTRDIGRPVDPLGTPASGAWDDAAIVQGSTPREGYTEFSTSVVVRVGPVLAVAGLASTLPEDLRVEGVELARLLAERIRDRLTALDAFED